MEPCFLVDSNVGRLARWLRIMGYDTLFPNDTDDDQLIRIALRENRVLLTKDTHLMRRRVATTGQLKAILIEHDRVLDQLHQVVNTLGLNPHQRQFSLCLECNQPLIPRKKPEVQGLVPPYIFKTQSQFMECPKCHRLYWRGTHWARMRRELEKLTEPPPPE